MLHLSNLESPTFFTCIVIQKGISKAYLDPDQGEPTQNRFTLIRIQNAAKATTKKK
jgi:hypothetical protein